MPLAETSLQAARRYSDVFCYSVSFMAFKLEDKYAVAQMSRENDSLLDICMLSVTGVGN